MNYNNKLSIKLWAEDDKPREKLRNKESSALSDAELLAILLGSGNKRLSAIEIAKNILMMAKKDLNALAKLNTVELMKIPGIGLAKASTVVAAMELGRRRQSTVQAIHKKVSSSFSAFELLKTNYFDLQVEEFWILILSRSNQVLGKKRISTGGVSGTVADNKLIFKCVLEHLGSSLIISHNHPSGNLKPSKADEQLTKKIKMACQNLDIQLLDHLIVYNESYFSFADEGLL
ncbi:MAG TPA: hypothetical protein DCX54_05210 [Flavobacteriales bacterium]|nr:hypothetical protein [Flavobacteriales bacterium]